jgi:predicted  nucleic acid-binding Zn-ribbon protein
LGLIENGFNLGDSLEAIRPWLSPVMLLAILGVVTRHYATVRRANTADRAIDVDAEGSLRDAYAAAVRGFREEVAALKEDHRRDMEEMSRRNRECDDDRELLRDRITALRAYADGLYRVILQNSASGVIALGDFPSEEIQRAAERVDQLFKRELNHDDPSR